MRGDTGGTAVPEGEEQWEELVKVKFVAHSETWSHKCFGFYRFQSPVHTNTPENKDHVIIARLHAC